VLAVLAGLGFLLAAVGLHGLVAQVVEERCREFGIRLALGARRSDVVRLVGRHAAVVGLAGGAIGVGLALVGSAVIQGMLFGVSPLAARVYLTATATLVLVVFFAGLGPARRATRVQPVDVLRAE